MHKTNEILVKHQELQFIGALYISCFFRSTEGGCILTDGLQRSDVLQNTLLAVIPSD